MTQRVLVTCEHCRKRLGVKQELLGKKVRCPDCQKPIVLRRTELPAEENFISAPDTAPSQGYGQPVNNVLPPTDSSLPLSNRYSHARQAKHRPAKGTSNKIALSAITSVLSVGLLGVGIWAVVSALTDSTEVAVVESSTPEVANLPEVVEQPAVKETPSTEDVEPEPTPEPVPQPEAPPSRAEQLLLEQKIALRADIVERVEACLKRIEEAGYGHVVVGRIEVPDGGSPRDVIAQTEILDGGYFVDAVATAGAPIHFFLDGYDRLDVLPRGDQDEVENVGVFQMQKSDSPGGILRGVLVANGSELPQQVKVNLQYAVPINQCSSANDRNECASEIIKRLKLDERVTKVVNKDTGEFEISGLQAVKVNCRFTTPAHDWFGQEANVAIDEVFNLGVCLMYRRDSAQLKPLDLKNEEWADNGIPKVDRLLKKLERNPNSYQSFKQAYERSLDNIESRQQEQPSRETVVVAGQIKVPGKSDSKWVAAQMRPTREGFFAAAVRPGAPMGFRLHGFDPLDFIPRGSKDGVEYAGVLRMKSTPSQDKSALSGIVQFEGGIPLKGANIFLHEEVENINWYNGSVGYHGENGGSGRRPVPLPKPRIDGNQFSFSGFSPIGYRFSVRCPGFVTQYCTVKFGRGEQKSLPPIFMYRTRQVHLNYYASADGDFTDSVSADGVVDTDMGRWRALDRVNELMPPNEIKMKYGARNPKSVFDLRFNQSGDTMFARSSYGPSYIVDLGSRQLDECRSVNAEKLLIDSARGGRRHSMSTLIMQPGHVYLMKTMWKHWILFRVDDITTAPIAM